MLFTITTLYQLKVFPETMGHLQSLYLLLMNHTERSPLYKQVKQVWGNVQAF